MDNWIVSTSAGIVLVAIGIGLMRSHLRIWGIKKHDSAMEDTERRFQHLRFRRRMQASAILTILGVLIPVGDLAIPWQQQQLLAWWAIYWIAVLLLTMWVIVLGMADVIATSAHARVALGRIRRKQRELESQVSELRRRRANGRDGSRN